MRRALGVALAVALGGALLLVGCGGDGVDVTLRWSFAAADGAPIDCAAAGVRTVHVFLGPLEPDGSYDREVRCEVGEEDHGLVLHGVAPGKHVLVIKGLATDRVRYELTEDLDIPTADAMDLGTLELPPYVPPP